MRPSADPLTYIFHLVGMLSPWHWTSPLLAPPVWTFCSRAPLVTSQRPQTTPFTLYKRTYLDTESQCRRNGVAFLPTVAESTGAWTPEALGMLKMICKTRNRWTGSPEAELMEGLLRELSVAIRTANAKAILRRVGELGNRRSQLV